MSKKLIYIASPVRAVMQQVLNQDWANQKIKEFAIKGCKKAKEMDAIPISPVLLFDGVYDEYKERADINIACEEVLKTCTEMIVVKSVFNKDSLGIQREIAIARDCGITILEV